MSRISLSEVPLVLIPALNEEHSVSRVVLAARSIGYPVCVIDDGSTDTTAQTARVAGAIVLRFPSMLVSEELCDAVFVMP